MIEYELGRHFIVDFAQGMVVVWLFVWFDYRCGALKRRVELLEEMRREKS